MSPIKDSDPKKLLVIDAGHSRTKFSIYSLTENQHIIVENKPFLWPEIKGIKRFNECLLIGTNHHQNTRLTAHIKTLKLTFEISTLGKDLRVPLHDETKNGTGCDRLAQAYGASLHHPNESCLIVSAGSAITIDYLDSNMIFKGGMIGLGLARYKDAMSKISKALVTDLKHTEYPGVNTAEAVSLGWFQMLRSTLNSLLETQNPDKLIFTGGDANLLQPYFNDSKIYPTLGADAMAHALGYIAMNQKLSSDFVNLISEYGIHERS